MPELEELLKTFDAFIQTPNGPEADRLKTLYEACLAGVENRRRNCDHQLENFLCYQLPAPEWVVQTVKVTFK